MSHTAKQKQKIRKRCARSAMISLTISQIRRLESEVGNDVVYSFAKLMFGKWGWQWYRWQFHRFDVWKARLAIISLTVSQIRHLEGEVGSNIADSFTKSMFGSQGWQRYRWQFHRFDVWKLRSAVISLTVSQNWCLDDEVKSIIGDSFTDLMFGRRSWEYCLWQFHRFDAWKVKFRVLLVTVSQIWCLGARQLPERVGKFWASDPLGFKLLSDNKV